MAAAAIKRDLERLETLGHFVTISMVLAVLLLTGIIVTLLVRGPGTAAVSMA